MCAVLAKECFESHVEIMQIFDIGAWLDFLSTWIFWSCDMTEHVSCTILNSSEAERPKAENDRFL